MEYRKIMLHSGDVAVSRLCFGAEPLGGVDWGKVSISEMKSAVMAALKLGWNFVDTAAIYGLGESERNLASIPSISKSEIVIATKIGLHPVKLSVGQPRASVTCSLDPIKLQQQLEDSMSRLRRTHLPLVFLHRPCADGNPVAVTSLIRRWIDTGLVGGYGLSNFDLTEVMAYHRLLPVSAVQFECSMLDSHRQAELGELVRWCKANRVLTMAYGVLKKGLLTGKYGLQEPSFGEGDRRKSLDYFQGEKFRDIIRNLLILEQQLGPTGSTLTSVAIRFVWDVLDVDVAIVGIKRFVHVNESQLAVGRALTAAELDEIKRRMGWRS
jgi:aryl-alcohol dehydrogenase-like predicted oxidoreductase